MHQELLKDVEKARAYGAKGTLTGFEGLCVLRRVELGVTGTYKTAKAMAIGLKERASGPVF